MSQMKSSALMILFSFTGMKEIKDSPVRVNAATAIVREMGGKVNAFYWILGSQYDTLFILDPNDEKLGAMVLAIARLEKIISSLP